MKRRIEKRKLVDLKEAFYVRLTLNQDRVEFFKGLIKAGQKLESLIVSDDGDLIDGRQRKAAYLELGISESECEIRHYNSLAEKIVAALRANEGGPLPPTPADLRHTLQILLEAKISRRTIIEQLTQNTGFPARLLQGYLDEVQHYLADVRVKKAVEAVVNQGKTALEAAEEFNVKLETLQENLGGKKKIRKGNAAAKHVKSMVGQHYRSLVYSGGQLVSKLSKDLQDTVVTPEEVLEVVKYLRNIKRRFDHSVEDWIQRLEAHSSSTEKAAVTLGKTEKKAEKKKQNIGKTTLEKMGLES